MKQFFCQFVSIIRITVSESARQSLCILLTGGTILVVVLLPFIITHQFGEAGRLVRDSALSLQLVTGLLLSVFLASSVYRNEIETGTMGVILCKPVKRSVFFLAKFCGIAVVLLIYSICMSCSTLLASLASRVQYMIDWKAQLPLLTAFLAAILVAGFVNYKWKRTFPSAALNYMAFFLSVATVTGILLVGEQGDFTQLIGIMQACVLLTAAVLILAGLSVVLAAGLGTPAAVIGGGVFFSVGLVMDYLYGFYGDRSLIVRILFFVVPNWQRFWVVDSISGGHCIPFSYFAGTLLYAFSYLAGILCGGILILNRVEVER